MMNETTKSVTTLYKKKSNNGTLTYDIMGRFQAAATKASELQVSSGPMKAMESLSRISVIFLMAQAAKDLVSVDGGLVPMSAATYFSSRSRVNYKKG